MSRYRRVKFGNKTAPEHRIIWEAAHGPIPEGYEIHHRNGNGKDNRLSNLLCLSRSEHVALHAQLRAYGNDPVDANDPDIKKSREGCRRYNHVHKEELAKRGKAWRDAHKEQIAEKGKLYYDKNKIKIKQIQRQYRETHKEQIAAIDKAYREANREKIAAKQSKYRAAHRDELIQKSRDYRAQHLEEDLARCKHYRETHKEELSSWFRDYYESHKEELKIRARLNYARKTKKPQEVIDAIERELCSVQAMMKG